MGEIIEDMGGVLSFTLFKVEKGQRKNMQMQSAAL